MWKKNNPERSKTEVRPRDPSGLSGVPRSLPGAPAAPVASAPRVSPRPEKASPLAAALRQNRQDGQSPAARPAGPRAEQTAAGRLPGHGDAASEIRDRLAPPPFGRKTPKHGPDNGYGPGHDKGPPRPLVVFTGRGGPYFGLLLKTVVCSLLTLGVYSFWGRTDLRRYLWANTHVLGEPLEYMGTGKELLLGFLIVLPFLVALSFLAAIAAAGDPAAGGLLLYLTLAVCYEYASYRALRYRLTRTRWRGIRSNLDGSAGAYAAKALALWAAVLCTAGLLLPYATAKRLEMKLGNIRIGNSRLCFDAKARGLYKAFSLTLLPPALALAALLVVIIAYAALLGLGLSPDEHALNQLAIDQLTIDELAIDKLLLGAIACALWMAAAWFFYRAALFRWLCSGLSFAGMRLGSTLTGGRYLRTQIGNGLMLLFSYFIALAWVIIRELRVKLDSVVFTGQPDLAGIAQDTGDAPETGEGLLEAFDVDIGL